MRHTDTDRVTVVVFLFDYHIYTWFARAWNIKHILYNICNIFQHCLSVDQAEKSAGSIYPSCYFRVFWLWMWTLVCKYLVCILYKLSTLLTHPCIQWNTDFGIMLSIPDCVWPTIRDVIVPLYNIYQPIENYVAFGVVYSLECSDESLGKRHHISVVIWIPKIVLVYHRLILSYVSGRVYSWAKTNRFRHMCIYPGLLTQS